jgi:hypothetical protein
MSSLQKGSLVLRPRALVVLRVRTGVRAGEEPWKKPGCTGEQSTTTFLEGDGCAQDRRV